MAISRVGSASALGTSTATSGTFTATNPAGIQSGDVLIATFNVNRDITIATPPTGWTLIRAVVDTTTTKNWLYWRVADGGANDVPSYGWTQPTAVSLVVPMHVVAYRGVDNAAPFVVENGVNHTAAASQVHTTPTVNNTDANAWGVAVFHSRATTSPVSWTAGAGIVEQQDTDGLLTSANDVVTQLCDTDGVFATGNVAFSSTCSQSNAAAVMWVGFLKPSSGTPPNDGTGDGAVGWAGSASGFKPSGGAASGAVGWAGSATGARSSAGAASGAVGWAGSAAGAQPGLAPNTGSATGAVGWAGSATGAHPHMGAASGAVGWAGAAAGVRHPAGAASGGVSWVGSSRGANRGTASGAVGWAGSATGIHRHLADATGAVGWVGSAAGSSPHHGAASGADTYAGTAAGSEPDHGDASGAVGWSGAAAGVRAPAGAATGAVGFAGHAYGEVPSAFGPVTGLVATPVSVSEIDLQWDALPTASYYQIERDGLLVDSHVDALVWADTGLPDDTQFCYRVRAVR